MINYQATCTLHPATEFPIRADKRDADEDKYAHARTPGSHTVSLRETDRPRDRGRRLPRSRCCRTAPEIIDEVLRGYK